MSDDLRERVARRLALDTEGSDEWWTLYMRRADAAIAIIRGETLEEAARVAEEQARAFENESREQKAMGYVAMSKRALQIASYFNMHAAAIRALKDKP